MAINAIIRFLQAARNLAKQGMTKELKALAKPEAAKSRVKELTTLI